MSFPLWYLLVPYLVFFLAACVFFFFNLYHITRFGLQTVKTTFLLGVYVAIFLSACAATLLMMMTVDWMTTISLFELLPFLNLSSPVTL